MGSCLYPHCAPVTKQAEDASRGTTPNPGSRMGQMFLPSLEYCSVLLVVLSCPTLCDLMDRSPPGSSVHGDSPGKNIGVGCHSLLQGIFPTQGLNPGLPHCRQILYHLSYREAPSSLYSSKWSLQGGRFPPGPLHFPLVTWTGGHQGKHLTPDLP